MTKFHQQSLNVLQLDKNKVRSLSISNHFFLVVVTLFFFFFCYFFSTVILIKAELAFKKCILTISMDCNVQVPNEGFKSHQQ